MIITYQQINEMLQQDDCFSHLLNFNRLFRTDDNYFVASKNWYEDEFFQWFKIQLKHYKVWNYHNSWDCDKYANAFQVFANICHAQTNPNKTEALAVAEIHYLPDNSDTPHAINCVFVDNGELRFIEPQTPEFITLSKQEQKNINFIKF